MCVAGCPAPQLSKTQEKYRGEEMHWEYLCSTTCAGLVLVSKWDYHPAIDPNTNNEKYLECLKLNPPNVQASITHHPGEV